MRRCQSLMTMVTKAIQVDASVLESKNGHQYDGVSVPLSLTSLNLRMISQVRKEKL